METEAGEVPAQRSGAACPAGAVTVGDWGWTDEGRQTFRAAPERQRGFRQETEALKVPDSRESAGIQMRERQTESRQNEATSCWWVMTMRVLPFE